MKLQTRLNCLKWFAILKGQVCCATTRHVLLVIAKGNLIPIQCGQHCWLERDAAYLMSILCDHRKRIKSFSLEWCWSCIDEQIPCRSAMRGSFPLNGTYFQVNEVKSERSEQDIANIVTSSLLLLLVPLVLKTLLLVSKTRSQNIITSAES